MEDLAQVDQLEAKACVRLVGAIARHRVRVFQARQRQLDVYIQRFLKELLEEAFVDGLHIDLFHKRHFDVDLREVRLAIGAEVFVAEAARNLEIAVVSREHQKLLKELRALRKREELARMHTARHKVVARAFRRALGENRGFDLEEILGIEIFPREERDFMPHDEVFLHRGAAQVEIAVFQPQQLVCLAVVGDFKRRGLALAENLKLADQHFQLACRHVLVDHVAGAEHDCALHGKHEFRTDRAGARKVRFAECVAVEYDLHQSRAVTKLHEDQRAEIAAHICPAHENDFFACVRFCEVRAVVGSFPTAQ